MAEITDARTLQELNKQIAVPVPAPDAGDPYAGKSISDILAETWPGKLVTGVRDMFNQAVEPLRAYEAGESQTPEQTEQMIRRSVPPAAMLALTGAAPGTFAATQRLLAAVAAPAAETAPREMLGVTLSEGQATRNLSQIQREQAAARGGLGPPAQKAAQAFLDKQKSELAAARDKLAREFDPYGARVAESAREAGEVVGEAVGREAQSAKSGVDTAYKEARSYPGEIHAGAFEGIGQKIKGKLTLGDEPIIIDEKLTPFANRMITEIEDNVSKLRIPNRADPFGQPSQENIVGVNLKGIDQWRKRLSAMRRDAFGSGNAADGRAAKGVLDAFDEQIDAAVKGGLFQGDSRAIAAWDAARAAHADYARTFKAGKSDPVGRVVQKIIGDRTNDPATPEAVANYLYGAGGVNPSSLNVQVTNRMKQILGERSPEWSAVKQGLFARLTEKAEGVSEMGAKTAADRLNEFLNGNGKSMAMLLYSERERKLLKDYTDLLRHIEVPQAGANWSNTATFAGQGYRPSLTTRVLEKVGTVVGMAVGAGLGHLAMPGMAGEAAGAGAAKLAGLAGQMREARAIARAMPVLKNVTRDFKTAGERAEKTPTPRNIALLTIAARNLANNLRDSGLPQVADDVLREVQGPSQAPADTTKGDKQH